MALPEHASPAEVRQVSGLGLKAHIDQNFAMLSNESLEYIKEKLIAAFFDPVYAVRKTVGSIMSMILVKGGFYCWRDLIDFLSQNLTHSDETVVENAM